MDDKPDRKLDKYEISHVKTHCDAAKERVSIPEHIRWQAMAQPTAEAIVFLSAAGEREAVTWSEIYEQAVEYAAAMMSLGVKVRDVVGISVPSSKKWLYVTFGAMLAGAVPIPIAITYKDGSDVVALLNKVATCSTFIVDTEHGHENWQIFKNLLSSYSNDGNAVSGAIPSLKYVLSASKGDVDSGLLTLEELLRRPRPSKELPTLVPRDIAALFLTSGSTGIPKVVAHTHISLSTAALGKGFGEFQEKQSYYNDRSFNWIGGWPLTLISGHKRVCRSEVSEPPKDLTTFIVNALKTEACTVLAALPPLLQDIMDVQFKSSEPFLVENIMTSGQPVSRKLSGCVGKMCTAFHNIYGATECSAVLIKTVTHADDFVASSCGVPIDECEAKVVGEDGSTLPINTTGELYIRGAMLFAGYFNDTEKTEAVMTDDGWYKTDDIAHMTETGEFIVEGRKSDVILCGGGDTIMPSILENVLKGCPGVHDAAIVPIPDDKYFQVLCACVVPDDGSVLNEEMLRRYCKELHAGTKQVLLPTYYLFFDTFPENRNGKTLRKDLARDAIQKIQRNK